MSGGRHSGITMPATFKLKRPQRGRRRGRLCRNSRLEGSRGRGLPAEVLAVGREGPNCESTNCSRHPGFLFEPWHALCRQIATGGLRYPDLTQRHQASFSLVALCVSVPLSLHPRRLASPTSVPAV